MIYSYGVWQNLIGYFTLYRYFNNIIILYSIEKSTLRSVDLPLRLALSRDTCGKGRGLHNMQFSSLLHLCLTPHCIRPTLLLLLLLLLLQDRLWYYGLWPYRHIGTVLKHLNLFLIFTRTVCVYIIILL